MQAVGSLAILGVTAIYASHTRRQVDLMSRTYRAQVSAPRLASLREFASHVPEWSREHRGLLANVNLIASFTSMSGAVTFPAARRSIDGFFGHIDNQAHPRIIEQIERLNVDLPDAISQAAQRAADAARQDAIWIAMFVATVGQELASPDPHGRSHEKLPEVWKAMQSVSPATLPTWDSLTATPLETSLSAAFVELQQVLNEALIAAREDT